MATEVKTTGENGQMLDAYRDAATVSYIDKDGEKKIGIAAEPTTTADYYRKAYEEQMAAQERAASMRTQEAQRLAEERKAAEAEQYGRTNRQLYTDLMMNEKTLPQRLAAMGITGGAAESSEIALRNGYAGNLGENERARIAGERAIDSEFAAERYRAQAEKADADNAALQSYYANIINQKNSDAQTRAGALAAVGDYSGYVEMGILDEEQATLLQKSWIAQNPKLAEKLGYVKKRSSGGSGARPKSEEEQLYDEAVTVWNSTQDKRAVGNYLVENADMDPTVIRNVQQRLVAGGMMGAG